VVRVVRQRAKINPTKALEAVLMSDFNIERSAAKIADVYASERARARGVGLHAPDDAGAGG
jgi:hypothetical protein